MPSNISRVKRYRDDVPLFSRFQIEHQIESAYSRHVNLPSGGAIVIDHTEALVSVDVNSGRSTKGSDIEETALRTNLEAADETARQLRLRDLGGLIVIDFIDMESPKNQREVETRLRDALHYDRARVQMGKISRFGLMELSRQRLRPALAETSYITCPRCTGTGHIRSTESAALHILRILEEEAMKDNTAAVHTQVPVDVATFLLNEKRSDLTTIELRHKVSILLIPNTHLETPQHLIERLRHDDLNLEDRIQPSYRMATEPEPLAKQVAAAAEAAKPRQEAAIKQFTPDQPAPLSVEAISPAIPEKSSIGLFARIASWFKSDEKVIAPVAKDPLPSKGRRDGQRDRDSARRNNRRPDGRKEGADRPRQERAPQPDRMQQQSDRQDPPREGSSRRQGRNQRDDGRSEPQLRSESNEEKKVDAAQPRQRGPRGEKRERPNAPVETASTEPLVTVEVSQAVDAPATDSPEAQNESNGEGSGRGRRGRRGRRGGRTDAENATSNALEPTAYAIEGSDTDQQEPVVIDLRTTAATVAASTESSVSAVAATPSNSSPLPVFEAPVSELPISAPEPIIQKETPIATFTAPVATQIPIEEILKSSGLTLVETSAERNPAALPVVEETPRPKRARPVPVILNNEALQQVETEK